MWKLIKPRAATLRLWQLALLLLVIAFWYAMTKPGLIPPMMFDNDRQAAFFFGEPVEVAQRITQQHAIGRKLRMIAGVIGNAQFQALLAQIRAEHAFDFAQDVAAR